MGDVMARPRILNAECGNCGYKLQVKTHSQEKVVACPKCNSSVKVSETARPSK